MPDLEATYLLAAAKGGAPSARTMAALNAWCMARGSSSLNTAQALYSFISAYAGTGSVDYTTPGTYTFTVPFYATLTVDVWGAGASGAVYGGTGNTGGTSSWAGGAVYASGGAGPAWNSGGGAGGSAGGGDVNYGGSAGNPGSALSGDGAGGAGANGGAGGASGGSAGAFPGGGGSGSASESCDKYGCTWSYDNGGGGGGYARKTYSSGALSPGSVITIVVGQGGAPASAYTLTSGAGANGRVTVSWR